MGKAWDFSDVSEKQGGTTTNALKFEMLIGTNDKPMDLGVTYRQVHKDETSPAHVGP